MNEPTLEKVNALFDGMFKEAQKTPRFQKQIDLEQAIVSFNADLQEAQELLDAFLGALKSRYPAHQLVMVEEEGAALRIALEEAIPYEPSEEDRKYTDHVHDKMDEARGL